jgi:glucose uptake protein GlcU
MTPYFIEWGHTYLVHLGAWVGFAIGVHTTKFGLPHPKQIPTITLSALILAAIVAIFSSHAHNHYLAHFGTKTVDNVKMIR